MTLDITKPTDNSILSDIIALLRETRAAINTDSINNVSFESGVQNYDAVYLDSSVNVWKQSLAGDSERHKFHGIANVDTNSVQIFGQIFKDGWLFDPGATVYVSTDNAGALTQVAPVDINDTLIAGIGLAIEYLLLDSQISASFTRLWQDYLSSVGTYASMNDRFNGMSAQIDSNTDDIADHILVLDGYIPIINNNNNTTLEVMTARGSRDELADRLNESINLDGTLKTTISASAWTEETNTIAKISSTVVTVEGDRTAIYEDGRPLRFNNNLYDRVISSTYDGGSDLTTITIQDGVLTVALTSIEFGFAAKEIPVMSHDEATHVRRVDEEDTDDTLLGHLTNLMYKFLYDHTQATGNVHSVTPAQIGAEYAFAKRTGFNKDFGTIVGTVCQGNDSRFTTLNNGITSNTALIDAALKIANNLSEVEDAAESRNNLGISFGVIEGDVVQVQADNKLPALDASDLTDVPGNVITTKGDIIVGDASGEPSRLVSGSNGQIVYYYDGTLVKMDAGTEGQAPVFTSDGHLVASDVYGEWRIVDTIDISSPTTDVVFEGLDGAAFDYKIDIEGVYGTAVGTAYLDMGYGETPTYVPNQWAKEGQSFVSGDLLDLFIISTVAYNSAMGDIKIVSHTDVEPCAFYHISATNAGGTTVASTGPATARWTRTDTVTAIKLRHSASTFAGGRVRLMSRAK